MKLEVTEITVRARPRGEDECDTSQPRGRILLDSVPIIA